MTPRTIISFTPFGYSKAIDAYLKMTAEESENLDELEGHWEHAVRLAMEHVRDRVPEVVTAVAKRLVAIKKYTQAAELLEGIDAHKEAIDVYVQAEMWDHARRLALKVPEFGDLVSHKKLTYYAERGEWDRCLEIAQQLSPEMVSKYAGLYANQLVQAKQFAQAIDTFAKYGSNNVPLPNNIPVYLLRTTKSSSPSLPPSLPPRSSQRSLIVSDTGC